MQGFNKISKYLSYILRHKPESIGLQLDSHGWIEINELISKTSKFNLTKELLIKITDKDSKKRFIIQDNKIRANQGHSIIVDLDLKNISPPIRLYHGTAIRFLDSIMNKGIRSQSRQYVHISDDINIAKNVGKRHGKVVILQIDSRKMYEDGYIFLLSENMVWLTNYIPVKYISILIERSSLMLVPSI